MTSLAISLVMVSAVLHASWNLICKTRKSPGAVFFLLFTIGSVTLWLPFVIWIFRSCEFGIPASIWALLILSGMANSIYYVGVANAYRLSDISLSYPLIKALPILFITVFCIVSGGNKATFFGLAGVSALLLGSLFIPMKKIGAFSMRNYMNRSFAFVFAAAVASTGYMLLDNKGMQIFKSASNLEKYQMAAIYIFFENLFILPFLTGFIAIRKEERKQLGIFLRSFSIVPFTAGVMGTCSYSLILMAMAVSDNVSLVVALRQLSIPLGALAGIILLKEGGHIPKIIGAAAIVGGLILVCI